MQIIQRKRKKVKWNVREREEQREKRGGEKERER